MDNKTFASIIIISTVVLVITIILGIYIFTPQDEAIDTFVFPTRIPTINTSEEIEQTTNEIQNLINEIENIEEELN